METTKNAAARLRAAINSEWCLIDVTAQTHIREGGNLMDILSVLDGTEWRYRLTQSGMHIELSRLSEMRQYSDARVRDIVNLTNILRFHEANRTLAVVDEVTSLRGRISAEIENTERYLQRINDLLKPHERLTLRRKGAVPQILVPVRKGGNSSASTGADTVQSRAFVADDHDTDIPVVDPNIMPDRTLSSLRVALSRSDGLAVRNQLAAALNAGAAVSAIAGVLRSTDWRYELKHSTVAAECIVVKRKSELLQTYNRAVDRLRTASHECRGGGGVRFEVTGEACEEVKRVGDLACRYLLPDEVAESPLGAIKRTLKPARLEWYGEGPVTRRLR